MLLLAIHYAIQPRLSKKYIAPNTSSTSVALVEEVTKTTLAAVLLGVTRLRKSPLTVSVNTSASTWTLSSSLLVAGIPAVLYAVQGVLQYTSHKHLDAVTFNGLSQTKTLSAALWCWILLSKPQSPLQIVALGILFGSAMLFQRDTTATTTSSVNGTQTRTSSNDNTKSSKISKRQSERFWLGIIPCTLATLLSGLAGALSQKGLQVAGGTGRDAYFYAMEVSFYSALTLLISQQRRKEGPVQPFWQGWTYQTFYPVLCKAVGGILTVLVHKYTGTVSKGFALMFGLVLAGMMESLIGSRPMPLPHVAGTLLVMLSGWLHLTQTP